VIGTSERVVTILQNGREYVVPFNVFERETIKALDSNKDVVVIPVNSHSVMIPASIAERALLSKGNVVIDLSKGTVVTPQGTFTVKSQPQPPKATTPSQTTPVSGSTQQVLLVPPKEKVKEVEEVKENVNVVERPRPITTPFMTPLRRPVVFAEDKLARKLKRDIRYKPSFMDKIAERVRRVIEPLISVETEEGLGVKNTYSPTVGLRKKVLFKPRQTYKFYDDYTYEPKVYEVTDEDYAPEEYERINYSPTVVEESYPVYNYSTFGIPQTSVFQYNPDDVVRIKPVTEFEITAKSRPLVVSQTHLLLLNKLMREVLK